LVDPGDSPFQTVPYGAPFEKQDMSGWDDMFPTISACDYPGPGENHGAPLPDHGEVWSLPWPVTQACGDRLAFSVEGRALPYRLSRSMEFGAPATLLLSYQLENLGQESMPYIWAAHPQFASGLEAEVVLPAHIRQVCNTLPATWGWGAPETIYDWPNAAGLNGNAVRIEHIGPPRLQKARKFFTLPDARPSWATLVRHTEQDWLRLEWNPEEVPYFGLWVDEGALNHVSVAAPEPTTGFYDSLALAWDKKEVTVIEAGAVQAWTLKILLGVGEVSVPAQLKRHQGKG